MLLISMTAVYQPTADDFSPDDLGPRRTSILSIISLILSLICIIPGFGLLGAIFGLAGLIGIMQSRGRVGGTGLAVAGMILGLLFSAVWIGIGLGMARAGKFFQGQLMGPLNGAMTAVEAGDHTAARTVFSPDAAAAITDAQFDAFRDSYRTEMGNFHSIPVGIVDYILGFQQVGPAMQAMSRAQLQNAMPAPAQFDKGWAVVVYEFVPSSTTVGPGIKVGTKPDPKGSKLQIYNLGIFTQDGKQIWLIERSATKLPTIPTAPADKPATPPPPPETPQPAPAGEPKGPG